MNKRVLLLSSFLLLLVMSLLLTQTGQSLAFAPTATPLHAPYGWNPQTPFPIPTQVQPTATPWWIPTVEVFTPVPPTPIPNNGGIDPTPEWWLSKNSFILIALITMVIFGVLETAAREQIIDAIFVAAAVLVEFSYPFFIQLLSGTNGNLTPSEYALLIPLLIEVGLVIYAVAAGGVDWSAVGLFLSFAGFLNYQGKVGPTGTLLGFLGDQKAVGTTLMLLGLAFLTLEAVIKPVRYRMLSGRVAAFSVFVGTMAFLVLPNVVNWPLFIIGLVSWLVTIGLILSFGGMTYYRRRRGNGEYNESHHFSSRTVYDVALLIVMITLMLGVMNPNV